MLCIGIDIGKKSHVAGFVSRELIARHRRFTACPTLSIKNSRAGFGQLLSTLKDIAPASECLVLIERTGHYGIALEHHLQEKGIAIYKVHVRRRPAKRKTDKRDALGLANMLYSQLVLGVQVDDRTEIRRELPPSEAAARLRGFTQYRIEINRDITRLANRLTALCDESFTEFVDVFKDPNTLTALAFREKFPLPADVARASIEELIATRLHTKPGNAALRHLQDLARDTIGNRDALRLPSLTLEQKHLIKRMRLLQADLESVEAEIVRIVEGSREGKILVSIPGISPVQAGIIIAGIGNIANFERASKLRGYFGWAPFEEQSGSSLDQVTLSKGGNPILKHTVYLIAWTVIRHDTEFRAIYERLVPLKCHWDKRTGEYHGKNKVIGRICGQLVGLIFLLLRRDYDMLAALPEGAKAPEPVLYSRETHRDHRLNGIRRP